MKKLITFIKEVLSGRMNAKMLMYQLKHRFQQLYSSNKGDDFYWDDYTLHYKGELQLGEKTRTLCLSPDDYTFSEGILVRSEDILPLHPNVHLLYQTVLQLSPETVLEVGCGGGDNLHNLKTLRPGLQISGVDVSREQLELLRTRHPDLAPCTSQVDVTKPVSPGITAELVYTQAVIMHIGEEDDRHLKALRNLFKLSTRYVLLMENWRKHSFLEDIRRLQNSGEMAWEHCHLHYARSTADTNVTLLIASTIPVDFPKLETYETLLRS